jgi:adenylate cyclase
MEEAPRAAARNRTREALLVVGLFALFAALTLPLFVSTESRSAAARNGRLAISPSLLAERPVLLQGTWSVARLASGAGEGVAQVAVPGGWEGTRPSGGRTFEVGEAVVYRLVLERLPAGEYRLFVPPIWGGSQVRIDGRLRSARGRVGLSAAESRYELRAHDVSFASDGGDVELAIVISTFRDLATGLRNAPVLGTATAMQQWTALAWARSFYVAVAFVIIGLFALIVFFSRPSDRSALFLALGCFALLGVQVISVFPTFFLLLPGVSYDAAVFAVIVCSFGGLMAWAAYVEALFPEARGRGSYRFLQAAIALGWAVGLGNLLVGGTLAASDRMEVFLACLAATGLFIFVRSLRALREGRDGSLLFFLGQTAVVVALGLQASVNLTAVYQAPIGRIDFAAYGLLLFAFTHLTILARRWIHSIGMAETLNDDLSRLLEVNSAVSSEGHLVSLLERIAGVSTRILDAERSSIFVYDAKRGELWTLVAEGLESREIRIPDRTGIAGAVFHSGRAEHVADAYLDPRFNRTIDDATGYRTRNLLCAPLTARDGRKLGVLQVINSRHGDDFSGRDMQRLTAFSAQAAVAIDNAELFAAVLESRNYNERILASMSSGVVTIPDDGGETRLNPAAARILGVSEQEVAAGDARAFLDRANPWLAEEIADVASGHEPRTILDHELRTVGNGTISANLSLVPLRDGERTAGVLLMIDDISASKRLEGTMRRFMTQEVMEQVLAHDGEALFGSACAASVLFLDIRGFTTLAERLSPRETVELLNELFGDMYEAVADASGMLDKFMGDALMAVYGAPLSSGRDAANAVTSGLDMLRRLDRINAARAARGEAPIRIGIGVSSGEVVAGTIGSPKRMDYTVIGDSVNLAARLQELTKTYGVELLICERTAAAIDDEGIATREIDVIRVRGRSRPAKVFEVLVRPAGDSDAHARAYAAYRRGRDCLTRHAWDDAVAAFQEALAILPADRPAQVMLGRAQSLAAAPPAHEWDGVWQGPAKEAVAG